MQILRWLATSTVFLTLAFPAHADLALEIDCEYSRREGEEDKKAEERCDAWIANQRARVERKNTTFILRADEGQMLLLYHSRKTYMVLKMPIRREDYVDAESIRSLSQAAAAFGVEERVFSLDQEEAVGPWLSRRYRWEETMPGGNPSAQVDFWVSEAVPVDLSLYEEILKAIDTFGTMGGGAAPVYDLEGFVVQEIITVEREGVRTVIRRTLKSIREVKPEAGRYDPPPEYQRVEVDRSLFGIPRVLPGAPPIP